MNSTNANEVVNISEEEKARRREITSFAKGGTGYLPGRTHINRMFIGCGSGEEVKRR